MPENRYCSYCGRQVENGQLELDGNCICSVCFRHMRQCRVCGSISDSVLNRHVCSNCLNTATCQECDRPIVDAESLISCDWQIDADNRIWCASCYTDSNCCMACYNRYHIDHTTMDIGGAVLCNSCVVSYFMCEVCDLWCHDNENDGNNRCSRCHEDDEDDEDDGCDCSACRRGREERGGHNLINRYDYVPTPHFYPRLDVDMLYLGVELEVDNLNDRRDTAHALNGDNSYYLKDDGSLTYGFEVVSHPCTLEYHQKTFNWPGITNILKENGGKSHQTNTCGLHVHFNTNYFGYSERDIDYNTMKLLYLVEKHWDNLVKFSRRDERNLNQWAARYFAQTDRLTKRREGTNLIKSYKRQGNRYKVVNLTNKYTIELRIFRGSLKPETVLACIEMTAFLATYAKGHRPDQLRKLSWFDLTNKVSRKVYPNLYQYLQNDRCVVAEHVRVVTQTGELQVGDSVRVRTEINEPNYCWGEARRGSVGAIVVIYDNTDIYPNHIRVDFPEHAFWLAAPGELERV